MRGYEKVPGSMVWVKATGYWSETDVTILGPSKKDIAASVQRVKAAKKDSFELPGNYLTVTGRKVRGNDQFVRDVIQDLTGFRPRSNPNYDPTDWNGGV